MDNKEQEQMNEALAAVLARREALEKWASEALGFKLDVRISIHDHCNEKPEDVKRLRQLARAMLNHDGGGYDKTETMWWTWVAGETKYDKFITLYLRHAPSGFKGLMATARARWNKYSWNRKGAK